MALGSGFMMIRIKQFVQEILGKFGYSLQRLDQITPVDVRKQGNDPRYLLCRVAKRPVLIDAPIDFGRGLPLFTFQEDGLHPFVRAVLAALNCADKKNAIRSVLKSYYELVQPANAAELLGLEAEEVPALAAEPSWVAILPWDEESIEQWRKNHQYTVRVENHRHGRAMTISDGWAWCGPATIEKLEIEVRRLFSVMTSIRHNGFRRHDGAGGDITAVVLMKEDGQWRWQAKNGQHRMSVLGALDFKNIPLRVLKIVNRADVDIWPNVISGVFSQKVALKLFDRIFEGVTPSIAHRWLCYVEQLNGCMTWKARTSIDE